MTVAPLNWPEQKALHKSGAPRDTALESSIKAIGVPGIMVDYRHISLGDELALMPVEATTFAKSVLKVRRASGAARIVARGLLKQLGLAETAIPKTSVGAPIWPKEVIGSLAHDFRLAIAAVGLRRDFSAVGIDVEPAELLPPDLLDIVVTFRERQIIDLDPYRGRLFFAAKEAVYKAVYPLDHVFLDHHDVEIDFATQTATVRNDRVVNLRFCISTHLVVLAFLH